VTTLREIENVESKCQVSENQKLESEVSTQPNCQPISKFCLCLDLVITKMATQQMCKTENIKSKNP
jgi:hypothetical protein